MKNNNSYPRIITDDTLRETVSHGDEKFPFSYYLENIWLFDLHCIDWHWHSEVEFVYVQKGTATVLIGNERYDLHEGTGVFINSQVIHRFEAEEDVIIPNIVFAPSLLAAEETLIYQKYVKPVLSSSMNCQIYVPDIPWQKEILQVLLSVFKLQEQDNSSEIKTIQLLLKLWNQIYDHMSFGEEDSLDKASVRTQARLQIMLQYIHKNYQKPITLSEIAEVAMLSKSSVLNLFHTYLHISPISYLVNYRLKQAARLLITTEDRVTSIAQCTGFENAGYFCRKFRELFRVTPGEYRKQHFTTGM